MRNMSEHQVAALVPNGALPSDRYPKRPRAERYEEERRELETTYSKGDFVVHKTSEKVLVVTGVTMYDDGPYIDAKGKTDTHPKGTSYPSHVIRGATQDEIMGANLDEVRRQVMSTIEEQR